MSSPKLSRVESTVVETQRARLLIIGNRGGSNVGESFERAAGNLGLPVSLLESRRAIVWKGQPG